MILLHPMHAKYVFDSSIKSTKTQIINHNLRDCLVVPNHRVGVISSSRIKPQVYALLATSCSVCKNIGLQNPWLIGHVPQKLKVHFIMVGASRRQLRKCTQTFRPKKTIPMRLFPGRSLNSLINLKIKRYM